jgi:hypothetical protein
MRSPKNSAASMLARLRAARPQKKIDRPRLSASSGQEISDKEYAKLHDRWHSLAVRHRGIGAPLSPDELAEKADLGFKLSGFSDITVYDRYLELTDRWLRMELSDQEEGEYQALCPKRPGRSGDPALADLCDFDLPASKARDYTDGNA